jgi:hypothetical protein
VRKTYDMVKDNGRSLSARQRRKPPSPLLESCVLDGHGGGILTCVDTIVQQRVFGTARGAASLVPAEVEGNGPDPRPQLQMPDALRVVGTEGPVGPNERLLSHVFRIVTVASELQRARVHPVLKATNEIGEGTVSIGSELARKLVEGCRHLTR